MFPPTPPCDIMQPNCPARAILGLLGEKWSLLTIQALAEGISRPGALRRRIGDVSEKMLLQTLRRLEEIGLVLRHDHAEVPPRVDYTLTDLGRSLSPLIDTFKTWVEAHTVEMLK